MRIIELGLYKSPYFMTIKFIFRRVSYPLTFNKMAGYVGRFLWVFNVGLYPFLTPARLCPKLLK